MHERRGDRKTPTDIMFQDTEKPSGFGPSRPFSVRRRTRSQTLVRAHFATLARVGPTPRCTWRDAVTCVGEIDLSQFLRLAHINTVVNADAACGDSRARGGEIDRRAQTVSRSMLRWPPPPRPRSVCETAQVTSTDASKLHLWAKSENPRNSGRPGRQLVKRGSRGAASRKKPSEKSKCHLPVGIGSEVNRAPSPAGNRLLQRLTGRHPPAGGWRFYSAVERNLGQGRHCVMGESLCDGGRASSRAHLDPDLAQIAAAWPELPQAVRAGIVAMVRTTSQSTAR